MIFQISTVSSQIKKNSSADPLSGIDAHELATKMQLLDTGVSSEFDAVCAQKCMTQISNTSLLYDRVLIHIIHGPTREI